MRQSRALMLAMLAMLAALVAGTAYGQSERYGDRAYNQGQYGPGMRQPAEAYDLQANDAYDRDQDPATDVGFFYDELSPYGEWVRHPDYGWAWFPRHVSAGWRPYALGRWVESDYGWTWVSDEPFGWATYHYGRWTRDSQLGWLWVPGTDWGPAWVAWQQGNGYVGWAPLPPTVGFQAEAGLQLGGLDLSFGIAPRDYSFVEERRFLDSRIGGYFVPEARNITLIHYSANVTNYSVVDHRVINGGVPVDRIERATGRRAQQLRIAIAANPRAAGLQRDVLSIYRPRDSNLQRLAAARRDNGGLLPLPNRSAAPPASAWRPETTPMGPRPRIPVAARVGTATSTDERQFRREQGDLKSSQDKDQRALEQIHRQEMAGQAKGNAQEMTQRHAAEQQAQQEQRQRAEQQLQVRQQIQRLAAQASTAKNPDRQKSPAAEPGKDKKDKQDRRGDDGH